MNGNPLDRANLVGIGRTAEIYAWGDGRVLRLFGEGASEQYAMREMNAFRIANEAQLPCPAVYPGNTPDGLVRIEGRLGFVMDRVEGPSMLQILTKQPWRLVSFARAMAAFHLGLHRQHVTDLPSQRQRFEAIAAWIGNVLGSSIGDRVRAALDRLPDDDALCHGDFHPDNILLGDCGATIIDWGPATTGAAAADVAWTAYLFKHAGYPPGMNRWQRLMLAAFRRLFYAVYKRAYARRAPFPWSEVEAWAPVIAAMRFRDQIPEEKSFLEQYLKQTFGCGEN